MWRDDLPPCCLLFAEMRYPPISFAIVVVFRDSLIIIAIVSGLYAL